jgi:hypothetical protein
MSEQQHSDFLEFLRVSYLRHLGDKDPNNPDIVEDVCIDIEDYFSNFLDSDEYKNLQKALNSLYIGIPSEIADDVKKKFDNFINLVLLFGKDKIIFGTTEEIVKDINNKIENFVQSLPKEK